MKETEINLFEMPDNIFFKTVKKDIKQSQSHSSFNNTKHPKIDFSRITNTQFYNLVNNTTKPWVLKQCLEHATNEQCVHLASKGRTNEIAMLFAKKLLPNATDEQCEHLAKYGRTTRIARLFNKKLEHQYYTQFL